MQLDSQFKDARETRSSQNLNSIELDFIELKTCLVFYIQIDHSDTLKSLHSALIPEVPGPNN